MMDIVNKLRNADVIKRPIRIYVLETAQGKAINHVPYFRTSIQARKAYIRLYKEHKVPAVASIKFIKVGKKADPVMYVVGRMNAVNRFTSTDFYYQSLVPYKALSYEVRDNGTLFTRSFD